MTIRPELLRSWPVRTRASELWRAACGEEVDPLQLARGYLRVLARAPGREEVFRALLEQGAFRLAERFPVPSARRDALMDGLREANFASWARLESQLAEFAVRCERMHRPDLLPSKKLLDELHELREECESHTQEGIDMIEQALADAELRHGQVLEERLVRMLPREDLSAVAGRNWFGSVMRAIQGKDFDIAERLLDAGPAAGMFDAVTLLPDEADPWPYPRLPAAEILRWLLTDEGDGGPREFYTQYTPAEDDDKAWNLLRALDALLRDAAPGVETVRRFADALEGFLGETPRGHRSVEFVPGGFRTRLKGLTDPAAPLLARTIGEGLSLYVEGQGGGIAPAEVAGGDPVLLFTPKADTSPSPGVLQITPSDLFRIVPDVPNRRLNLLRTVVQQLPTAHVHNGEPSRRRPPALHDRSDVIARLTDPQGACARLVFGCPGVGTSAVLQNAAFALEQQGWEVLDLTEFLPGRSTEVSDLYAGAMQSGRSPLSLLHQRGKVGLAITSDGITDEGLLRIPDLLGWARQFEDTPRLLLAMGLDERERLARYDSEVQAWQLEALPFASIRTLIGRMLYVRGVRWRDNGVLDRFAYYTGGRPALAHLLIERLLAVRADGGLPAEAPLKRDLIEETVRDAGFEQGAYPWLLGPVERDPELRMIYAAVIATLHMDGSLLKRTACPSYSQVLEFLYDEGVAVIEHDMLRSVARLAKLELLEPAPGIDNPAMLAPGAIPLMSVRFVGEPFEYFMKAKRAAGFET